MGNESISLCVEKKPPIMELCKCTLFLPERESLIFKIPLKVEAMISRDLMAISCVISH